MRKNTTRNDIAAAASVSPSTVSRALAGSPLLPASTIAKVRAAAEKMGYKPNILGKRLAANRSFQLAFAIPADLMRVKGPFRSSYYSDILNAVIKSSDEAGYGVSIYPYAKDEVCAAAEFKRLADSKYIDGLILIGLERKSRLCRLLEQNSVKAVVISSAPPNNSKIPSVNFDPAPAMKEFLEVLEKNKFKRLFFVHGDLAYFDAMKQLETLKKIIDASSVKLAACIEGNYTRISGYNAAKKLVPSLSREDCVFLATDRMASGFYRYCNEHGIKIPQDISVMGSDNDEISKFVFPELSTIHQPRAEAAAIAVKTLITLIQTGKTEKIHYSVTEKFLTRESIAIKSKRSK